MDVGLAAICKWMPEPVFISSDSQLSPLPLKSVRSALGSSRSRSGLIPVFFITSLAFFKSIFADDGAIFCIKWLAARCTACSMHLENMWVCFDKQSQTCLILLCNGSHFSAKGSNMFPSSCKATLLFEVLSEVNHLTCYSNSSSHYVKWLLYSYLHTLSQVPYWSKTRRMILDMFALEWSPSISVKASWLVLSSHSCEFSTDATI